MSFTNYEFPNVSAYDSDLRELLKLVKELYNNYNTIFAEFQNIKEQFAEFKAVIDALPDTIKTEVSEQLKPFEESLLADIEDRFADIRIEIDALYSAVSTFKAYADNLRAISKEEIAALDADVTEKLRVMRVEYLTKIRDIQKDIDALQWQLPNVYNIVRGVTEPLIKTIYDIYDELRYHALTCGEYDALGLTCGEYDALGLRVIDYDVRGEWALKGRCCDKIRNPYTGLIGNISDVIEYMALNYVIPNNLTCGEYDALGLTCGEYDSKDITCYQYDFYGKEVLTI